MLKLKTHLAILTLALAVAAPMRAGAEGPIEADPAYLPIEKAIDLKTIRPEVNVNLPKFLLRDAVSELDGSTNDPFAAMGISLSDLVKDVKLIRVVVIDSDKANQAALATGVSKLREILDSRWTSIAIIPDGNVGVYAMGDPSGESMTGLALLVHDGSDAVIANIVGRVSIGKIVKVASRFDKFPKDLLKKLAESGGGSPGKGGEAAKPAPAPAKTSQ